MRRRLILLLALLLSAFFTACRMEDYYPSKVSEYFPKPEGSPAEDPGIPVISADTTVPRDSIRSDTTAVDTLKPVVPVDTLKLVAPVDTLKPVVPVDTLKPVVPVDTLKPVVRVDTLKPVVSVDTLKPVVPVDTLKPVVPADTLKPVVPKDTAKPVVPVDTTKPSLPATVPALLRANLDDQLSSCWGARGGSGYSLTSCGVWSQIGSFGSKLVEGLGRGGSKALSVTFSRNEEVAGASLPVSADTVNVRAWYNFTSGFDFGQGVKIGRISSFNEATQMNDIDIIMTVRSAGGSGQCGTTPMADLGIFFNGRPVGYDWGSITAFRSFQPGTWHSLEYQVALNTPGRANGSVRLWVDGVLAAQRTGLNIRGGGGSSVKLNRLRIGGWYSNSANGNSCANPAQPSTMLIDDVAVGKGFIGLN